MIDRAFSSRYRWARRGQRQCVFCACSPGQRSVGGAAHRSGIIPSHRAALVSGDRLQTVAACPFGQCLTTLCSDPEITDRFPTPACTPALGGPLRVFTAGQGQAERDQQKGSILSGCGKGVLPVRDTSIA